jgi:hypothetical protein
MLMKLLYASQSLHFTAHHNHVASPHQTIPRFIYGGGSRADALVKEPSSAECHIPAIGFTGTRISPHFSSLCMYPVFPSPHIGTTGSESFALIDGLLIHRFRYLYVLYVFGRPSAFSWSPDFFFLFCVRDLQSP